jgi:hypothetical protein
VVQRGGQVGADSAASDDDDVHSVSGISGDQSQRS